MYDYIRGILAELTPTQAVLDNNGIGYRLQISLQTYGQLQGLTEAKIFVHHIVKEDDEQLFGFAERDERDVFVLLISVSGIGPNTARMMLSSLTSDELRQAILAEDLNRIKSVKGIGLKTAQRLIIELKSKLVKGGASTATLPIFSPNPARAEAAAALQMLGFAKAPIDKALDKILKEKPDCGLEEMIKSALKLL